MINFIGFIGYDDVKQVMVTSISEIFFKAIVTESLFTPSKTYMPIDDDQLIIDSILNGDTTAFAVLVNRYKNMVFTLAFRMLKNREEAEELAQDTFVKIFRSLKKFKGDSKFSTWVYRITYNGCLDRLKKLKNEPYVVTLDEFDKSGVKTMDNALDFLEQRERAKLIQNSLQDLPNDYGLLLTLFYFEELSLEEISAIVGMTSNHVKVKLFRARKRLAKILRTKLEPETIRSYGQRER